MAFTLKNLKQDPVDVGSNFDGPPDLEFRMATQALELAQSFTAFYRDCQIVGSDEQAFRLALSDAAQAVLARALDLLGVSAPREM